MHDIVVDSVNSSYILWIPSTITLSFKLFLVTQSEKFLEKYYIMMVET